MKQVKDWYLNLDVYLPSSAYSVLPSALSQSLVRDIIIRDDMLQNKEVQLLAIATIHPFKEHD
jgi:hypothetical protein